MSRRWRIGPPIAARTYLLHGGFEFDGRPISGVFALTDASQEEWVAARLRAQLPDLDLTLAHELGRLGLIERENAATLNACLVPLARRTIDAFRATIAALNLEPVPRLFLSQNDGMLMDAEVRTTGR